MRLYVQDDIKVKPNLTVNRASATNTTSGPWKSTTTFPSSISLGTSSSGQGFNPLTNQPTNISDQALMSPNFTNFAPRVGLSYGLGNKTTIRAGYGIFYSSNYFWEGQGARGTWPYALGDTIDGINTPGPAQFVDL